MSNDGPREYMVGRSERQTRMYNFGVYHWRRRLRALLLTVGMAVVAAVCWRRWPRRFRPLAVVAMLGAALRGGEVVRNVLSPPPWTLERYKYDALAAEMPLENSRRLLDVGCGTGRSLVGLAPHLPESCAVLGLDVFDDRVILGNGPALVRRNGRQAGINVTPVVGDAARLPLASDSQDAVTACRVLHDLPASAVDPALSEARRVCAPDGRFGLLELPLTPDGVTTPPEEYWHAHVTGAGFDIETAKRIERKGHDGRYVLIVARP